MLDLIRERLKNYSPVTVSANLPQAGVLIAVTDETIPKVVLTKRASQLSSHSGEVAFPGGKRDDSDPSVVFTALREAHEEVDLNPFKVDIIGKVNDQVSLHNLKVTPSVGVINSSIVLTANEGELDCVFKVPLTYFLDPSNRCDHLPQYRNKSRFAPCYLYNGHLIWGLTSYILVEFLNITLDAEIELKPRTALTVSSA